MVLLRQDILRWKKDIGKHYTKLLKEILTVGIEMYSDEWFAYKIRTKLNDAHTRRIESLWGSLKTGIVRRMHGIHLIYCHSYETEQR